MLEWMIWPVMRVVKWMASGVYSPPPTPIDRPSLVHPMLMESREAFYHVAYCRHGEELYIWDTYRDERCRSGPEEPRYRLFSACGLKECDNVEAPRVQRFIEQLNAYDFDVEQDLEHDTEDDARRQLSNLGECECHG